MGGPIEGTSDPLISTIGKGRKASNIDEGGNLSTHWFISFPCIPDLDMNNRQSCHSSEENMSGDNTVSDAYILNWARTATAATMRERG